VSEFLSGSLFFAAGASLLFYEVGLLLKKRFKLAILNPLLIASVCVMVLLRVLDMDTAHYQEGAKYLSYLLTPATVALAVPLYQQLSLLKENLAAIAVGIVTGTLAALGSITLMAKLFALDRPLALSFLPKSITTAIGMGVSEEIGGIAALTAGAIVFTGILGSVAAEGLLRLLRVRHPIAKGLAIGTASHAIGTAKALELGEVEGAMSSLSIAVAGVLTVVLAPLFAQLL